ncbi:hypothetical protein ABH973_004235 [Bradyrhizobium ottawaense]|jgi:hypothetical protein|nr:hypothetical protein [Bradyrhizobium sp. CCBAU 21360]MDA9454986.1 hypothetical protein [Bradyrhizobium sp. CCBAU 21359]MDA9517159.1 hypothetical protein [Bradyrhizobium sp. CCBAU 11430]BBO14406.1 hypothetical protein TM102_58760 [Bradyrhizobium sp. TM102]
MDNSFDVNFIFGRANGATGWPMHAPFAMFREKARRIRGNFRQFSWVPELASRLARLYSRNREGYDPPAIRPTSTERKFMHITVAHISPILSLIAGVLILIMPRLLNLIVAIFLIVNGAIGLGLLKWLRL